MKLQPPSYSPNQEKRFKKRSLNFHKLFLQKDIALPSSTSDGYDTFGGEDGDQIPLRFLLQINIK